MMQPITIKFTITRSDVLTPGLRIYMKRPMFWFLVMLSVMCIVLSFFLSESYVALRVVGIVSLITPVLVFILAVLAANRKLTGNEIIYTFSEEGIKLQLPSGTREQDWSSVTRFINDKEHFMLFCSAQRVHLIPKRAFETPSQVNAFLSLLAAKRPNLGKAAAAKT